MPVTSRFLSSDPSDDNDDDVDTDQVGRFNKVHPANISRRNSVSHNIYNSESSVLDGFDLLRPPSLAKVSSDLLQSAIDVQPMKGRQSEHQSIQIENIMVALARIEDKVDRHMTSHPKQEPVPESKKESEQDIKHDEERRRVSVVDRFAAIGSIMESRSNTIQGSVMGSIMESFDAISVNKSTADVSSPLSLVSNAKKRKKKTSTEKYAQEDDEEEEPK